MNVRDVLQRCSHLKIEEKNDISKDYAERVFLKEDFQEWEKVLTDLLGPAVKRAGEKTTQAFSQLTIDYGGLLDDQILYYKQFKDTSLIAMFWPWKDNNQVTLKIACIKKQT